MALRMTNCEDCGDPIVVWEKQLPLCHRCQHKREQQASMAEMDRRKAVKATGTVWGLDQWL